MMNPEPSERASERGPGRLLARDEAAEELEHLLVLHARHLGRGAGPARRLGGADGPPRCPGRRPGG